jgi:hypothetical protein
VVDSNPSNSLPAGNTLLLFKSWPSILWLSLHFGPQRHKFTRIKTLSVCTITIDIAFNHGFLSPSHFWFKASSASISVREWFLAPRIQLYIYASTQCPNFGGNIPVQMPYVKYEGKSTVGNTRWPGTCIKRALPRYFPYLRYEVLHWWTHRVPHIELGFDLVSPHAARVEVAPAHAGSSRGTQIWVS